MSQREKRSAEVALGARVWVEQLKDHGSVVGLSDDGQRAVVELGKVRFNLALSSLAPGRERGKGQGEKTRVGRPPCRRPVAVPEVDMHGLRVDEMLVRLDRFLNDALLGGADEVRIIHGHGSGALKKALHQRLAEMGFRHFRLGEPGQTPGGDGVTILSL